MSEERPRDGGKVPWSTVVRRGFFLVAGGVALYLLGPRIIDVLASAPRLADVQWWWFPVIFAAEIASFVAIWELARIAVPDLPWPAAATAQLAANASSRVFPGGPMVGGAVYYRMLAGAGVDPANAASALTANSFISNLVLFALPAVAAIYAAFTVPVPNGLVPVVVAAVALFIGLFAAGTAAAAFDWPLRFFTWAFNSSIGRLGHLLGKELCLDASEALAERDRLISAIRPRWHRALAAASANWLFDYLALVAALFAVGARPRLSLVLVAYGAAAVLTMIPITPGGLGFVEAGLTATLTAAGVSAGNALVATLAYRLASFWLPIPLGGAAYLLHRRLFGEPERADSETA